MLWVYACDHDNACVTHRTKYAIRVRIQSINAEIFPWAAVAWGRFIKGNREERKEESESQIKFKKPEQYLIPARIISCNSDRNNGSHLYLIKHNTVAYQQLAPFYVESRNAIFVDVKRQYYFSKYYLSEKRLLIVTFYALFCSVEFTHAYSVACKNN